MPRIPCSSRWQLRHFSLIFSTRPTCHNPRLRHFQTSKRFSRDFSLSCRRPFRNRNLVFNSAKYFFPDTKKLTSRHSQLFLYHHNRPRSSSAFVRHFGRLHNPNRPCQYSHLPSRFCSSHSSMRFLFKVRHNPILPIQKRRRLYYFYFEYEGCQDIMATLTCHDYGADMDLYGSDTDNLTMPVFLNATFASYLSGDEYLALTLCPTQGKGN